MTNNFSYYTFLTIITAILSIIPTVLFFILKAWMSPTEFWQVFAFILFIGSTCALLQICCLAGWLMILFYIWSEY